MEGKCYVTQVIFINLQTMMISEKVLFTYCSPKFTSKMLMRLLTLNKIVANEIEKFTKNRHGLIWLLGASFIGL